MSYIPRIGPATTTVQGIVKLAGDLSGTADAPTVQNVARANGGGLETVSTANTGSAYTINLASGNVFNLTANANVTFTFAGATSGKACSFSLYVKQDATGGRTVTWPASVRWSGGAPVLSTAANALDALVFESLDGGSTWFGSLVGTNFA